MTEQKELEWRLKILKFQQWVARITDEDFQKQIRERIAELEQQLREIDE